MGRVSSAIYLGTSAELSGALCAAGAADDMGFLLKRPFNPSTLPDMSIRKLFVDPGADAQSGFRIGSRTAPLTPLEWEGRFTSRLTYYAAAGDGQIRQNALLHVLRLGNGQIYIPTDRATGAALYRKDQPLGGSSDRALYQVELLKLRPSGGAVADDGGDGQCVLSGFTSGTLIETPTGEVAVESLRAGDLVNTVDHGPRVLKWVGRRDLPAQEMESLPQQRPILISAGALGRDMPSRDLLVSPFLRLRLRSRIARNLFDSTQVLVLAKQLCQVEGIDIRKPPLPVSYVHLMFDQHELITANGAVAESFAPGKRALRSIDPDMQRDLFAACPDLAGDGAGFAPARMLLSGHQGRKLVVRHIDKNRPLVT